LNDEQFANAPEYMPVSLPNMVTSAKFVQPLKVFEFISVIPAGSVIDVSEEQLLNAAPVRVVSELGKVTLSKSEQFKNAF